MHNFISNIIHRRENIMDNKVKGIIIAVVIVVILAVAGLFAFKTIQNKKASDNTSTDITSIIATDVTGTDLVDSLVANTITQDTDTDTANQSESNATAKVLLTLLDILICIKSTIRPFCFFDFPFFYKPC